MSRSMTRGAIAVVIAVAAIAIVWVWLAASSALSAQAPDPGTLVPVERVLDAASASMWISPALSSVSPGETFTVSIWVSSSLATRGAQVALSFDPAIVQVDSVAEGSFYSDWAASHAAATLVYPQPVTDNVSGTVSTIGVSIVGMVPGGPTGSGPLCIYVMHSQAGVTGDSALILAQAKVNDTKGAEILPLEVITGSVASERFDVYVPLALRIAD